MTGFDAIGPDHPIARGIQVIAACMLVVTALRALLCHAQNAPDRGPSTRPRARLFPFMAGLSLSLTNPMNIAFYAAVLPTFAVSADPAAIAFVAVLVLTALTFGDLMYLLIAHRCRAFLTTPRRYAPVAGAANAIFLMVGLWILAKSAGLL
jgi:threonine/homoserine/homoserine lactone efflux protein